MNGFWSVCKRELKGYFSTPVAYVFLVIFLEAAMLMMFEWRAFFEMGQADMRMFFINMPLLFVFLIPCTTMRLWAEERRNGSIELLFTLPITIRQAVLGKFVAAWLFIGIALLLTFTVPLTIGYLGNPDWGLILTGYIGSFLMAGGFLAIGSFFSALSKNQVISFILAAVACGILAVSSIPSAMDFISGFVPNGFVSVMETYSFQRHFDSISTGILDLKDISYFAILIVGWLAACMVLLQERKAA